MQTDGNRRGVAAHIRQVLQVREDALRAVIDIKPKRH